MNDLDRYYTPKLIAEDFLSDLSSLSPRICVDSTCGGGSLLDAANNVFGGVRCVGIDRDKNAIANLRRKKPKWTLSVADLLNPQSIQRTVVLSKQYKSDLLLLNPPFSYGRKKSHNIEYREHHLKVSTTMAHVLTSFKLFMPKKGAFLIVPESFLYSDLDEKARELLFDDYHYRVMGELHCSTFHGARARSTAINILPGPAPYRPDSYRSLRNERLNTTIVRGALPVHLRKNNSRGVPYIHTTDLKTLTKRVNLDRFSRTNSTSNKKVSGWVILIPRVGIPDLGFTRSVFLKDKVQLSDCVIALCCQNKSSADKLEKRIKNNWGSFVSLYRGTGARYITLSRLSDFLEKRRIISS